MNIKSSYKYQMIEFFKALLIYLAVIIGMYVLGSVLMMILDPGSMGEGSITGTDSSSFIFIFVMGLCSFKENFHFMMQNGISRKTFFVSKVLTMLCACFSIAFIGKVISLTISAITSMSYNVTYLTYYDLLYNNSGSALVNILGDFGICLAAYLFFVSLGNLISVLYFRMNKALKIIVSVGVPVTLLVILPMVDEFLTNGVIFRALFNFAKFVLGIGTGNVMYPIVSSIVAFIILNILAWLGIRKAVQK